ncbi:DUF349 domain-containing protein [Halomonas denitrificans]|nr:DUF349 domain-containing protein [Halomonas denitrificans]
MSLKERLFGLPWEHKDTATRTRAVAEGADPRLRDALPRLASDDPEAAVRLAALKRMDDESHWLAARADDGDAGVRDAADRALVRLVAEPGGDLEARRGWLKAVEDGNRLRQVAERAADEALRRDALARIQAQGFLGDRYCDEPSDALAAEILARLDQVSTLKRIADRLRTRHKQRHHAALERLASLEGDDRHETRDALALELIERIEQLARGQFTGDRAQRADALQRDWEQLADPDPAHARRFDGAMRIVRRALEPRPEPATNTPEPSDAADDDVLHSLVDRVQALASRPLGDDSEARLKQLVTEFEQAWKSLEAPDDDARAKMKHFHALADELRARLKPAAPARPAREPTPAPAGPDPESLEALDRALEAADAAIEHGEIPPASEAISRARSAHDRIPKKHRPRDVEGRLNRMARRLKEMRDWQHWSNNKLRERLIQRAEDLDAAELHPDAITERLKELRERWRDLDRQEILPGEKRKFAAPHAQWRRFQAACKEAFEGAKPYLEKRTEAREASLDEVNEFLAAADQLVRDPEADRDALVRHQRAARQVIRNLEQVPPKARGKVAKRLRALMDRISARLDEASEAIEQEKRRLVAEARKLAHEKDRAVAIDRAKALQAEWKKAGRGRRKVEDALWKEFREPIDPLFEGLKQERDERRQAEKAAVDALKSLCEKAEVLAEADDAELDDAAGPLAGLEAEFNQHGRVPPALRKRMEAAIERHRQRIRERDEARERAAQAHLEALTDALQSAWGARAEGKAAQIDRPDVPEDDELARKLDARLDAFLADDATPDVLAEQVQRFTDQARQVCVEMECLSGLDTPAADKQLRMDYQLGRLAGRLGEGAERPDLDTERSDLRERWLNSFPHDPEAHGELEKRFAAADRILKQMGAS